MELRHLGCFLAVAELHFARAADRLHIEKSEAEASVWIKKPTPSLQQAGFRERVRCALANDDVVQHAYVDERQRSLQPIGQRTIRARRLCASRGVLVRKNYRAGIQLQCPLHDHTRINRA